MKRICDKCGVEISGVTLFCPECGVYTSVKIIFSGNDYMEAYQNYLIEVKKILSQKKNETFIVSW